MHIILTGATGTLGSQILFSLLESRFEALEKIYLIVRKKKLVSPETRISTMLDSSFVSDFIREHKTAITKKIEVVCAEQLLEPTTFLQENTKYHFIHSAGFVNLSIDPNSKEEIFKGFSPLTKTTSQNLST
jgi:thioester reductase-like protein